MTIPRSDAFVFFGATGDLAYKKIFPALQALIRRGDLDMPVIGMARAGWTLDKLRERARDSLAQNGGIDAGNTLLASHRVAVDLGARPERGSGADEGSWPDRRPVRSTTPPVAWTAGCRWRYLPCSRTTPPARSQRESPQACNALAPHRRRR